MQTIKSQIKNLPQTPGIYKYFDSKGELLYVGKSINLKKRVASYFVAKDLGPKTNLLVQNIAKIEFIKVFSEFEALMLESDLIRFHKPFYNSISKDDKSPIYIKITKDVVPQILLVRKPVVIKGDFVKGPLPSAKTAKQILKKIRRIFPYCQHQNPKKPCLYVHLGLCPYPYKDEEARLEYLKSIGRIKKLLSGQRQQLLKELTGEMRAFSKAQQFEKASEIKKQIESLQFLTTSYHDPREYLEQPSLVDDKTHDRLTDLQQLLNLPTPLSRIECYDISNISGKNATGSMVVFTEGSADKSQYRRFKIKILDTPNDFLMMRQVLTRRLRNDWPKPSLMVIDGGKGQLGVAVEVLNTFKQKIPVVGLAKRYEEIFLPNNPIPLKLSKESPARQLVQAMRDEAHRFAITYHRKLRAVAFLDKDKG